MCRKIFKRDIPFVVSFQETTKRALIAPFEKFSHLGAAGTFREVRCRATRAQHRSKPRAELFRDYTFKNLFTHNTHFFKT